MLAVILFVAGLLSFTIILRSRKPNAPYPPGPKSKTILGNAYDLPKVKPWLKYMEWSKQLNSGILHVSSLHSHIIILNKTEDAIALLERRSGIYSSRPVLKIGEMINIGRFTAELPYGDTWRKHRKVWQEGLRKEFLPSYHHQQIKKVHVLLALLLSDPAEFVEHCKMIGSAVALATGFGYELESRKQDRLVEIGDIIGKAIFDLLLPGRTLIQVLPFLGDIPPWIPGAAAQKYAAQIKKLTTEYNHKAFEGVKRKMLSGTAEECMVTRALGKIASDSARSYDENTVKEATASIYFAATGTLQCAHLLFIFTMALHPLEQKKAQEEIDRVVGTGRLPTFEDRTSLPYVEALHREVLRWRPVSPINSPHSPMQDDLYKGFFIPKNAAIVANIWAISRDETSYQNPDDFMPERFFNKDGSLNKDTVNYVYGFGRRICPGRDIADSMLWFTIVSVLSTFNIMKAKDPQGNEIDIDPNGLTDSVVSFPLPFTCSITPRSKQAEMLIRAEARQGELFRGKEGPDSHH